VTNADDLVDPKESSAPDAHLFLVEVTNSAKPIALVDSDAVTLVVSLHAMAAFPRLTPCRCWSMSVAGISSPSWIPAPLTTTCHGLTDHIAISISVERFSCYAIALGCSHKGSVHARQLHDGTANLKVSSSTKKASLLLKLDITKTFDSIFWPFLIDVMKHFGFGQIWRDIICRLVSSSSTQVLLNGFPGNCIKHQRALR
jgi:hypothetical protein